MPRASVRVNGHCSGTLAPAVAELSWKAQLRLCRRYRQLTGKGKPTGKVVTAIARELVGFIWALGHAAENQCALRAAA